MTGRRLILCLFLIAALSAQASAATLPVIVQLSPLGSLSGVLSLLGGTLVDTIPGTNIYLININALNLPLVGPTLTLAESLLGIQWIEFNNGVTLLPMGQLGLLQLPSSGASDWYKYQPAMQLTNAQKALAYANGHGVVVADINSLVDYSHPALKGHLTGGYDFISAKPSAEASLNQSGSDFLDQSGSDFLDQSGSDFLDQNGLSLLSNLVGNNPAYGHGTLCAGIIAVSAPGAMIMPLRAFDNNGSSDEFMLAKAIRYAVDHGAQVINMSFGTLSDSPAIHSSINYAVSHGVTLVASAGNNNTSAVQYPAAYAGVTAVSATDDQDIKGSFSNYGAYVAVDAPGVNIISAYPGGMYSMVSGTSFSAPMVSATAALVRSMTMSGAMTSISSTTVNINTKNPQYINQLGTGRINVLAAVHH
jgi:subtilisin family serine protease